MKFVQISFGNIKAEIERFLKEEHDKANILFSPASPFGQILNVLENLHQLSFLYLKNSIVSFDLSQPNSNNPIVVRNSAILAGHIPGRNISATGTLKLTVKQGLDIQQVLQGGTITFNNKNVLKNKTNGLFYCFNLGKDSETYNIISNGFGSTTKPIYIPIIQGKYITSTLTGDGNPNQTYQITETGLSDIENFNVEVLVNGMYWTIKRHIYDLSPNEEACVVRTGFDGGINVIFGNGGFGAIPILGATIVVSYLRSEGSEGNIFRRTSNDWNFVDTAIDGFGGVIDPSEIFNVDIYNDINFGADRERIEFTKNILPIASNNFVLALPQQYAYEIKKLGVFSHVNAYEDNSIVYIVVTPNVKLFKNQNSDYFSVSTRAFELDDYEKLKIDRYLRNRGNIQITKKYRIDSPKLSYYVLNIFLIRYSDSTDDSVQSEIINVVSEYFLNFNRMDRIPKSDIIKVISQLNSVHSVDIQFISKKNEDYHRQEILRIKNSKEATKFSTNIAASAYANFNDSVSVGAGSQISSNNVTKANYQYDPNYSAGIDAIMGDVLFEKNEFPIIRGGWYDRNGIYFSDDLGSSGLKSINIIKKGVVDSKNRNNIV